MCKPISKLVSTGKLLDTEFAEVLSLTVSWLATNSRFQGCALGVLSGCFSVFGAAVVLSWSGFWDRALSSSTSGSIDGHSAGLSVSVNARDLVQADLKAGQYR